jgi:uncharacterized membrane protein
MDKEVVILLSTSQTIEDMTQRNIETVAQMEQALLAERKPSDRIAETIAQFCGSIAFVWVHILWFGGWAIMNTVPGVKHLDPFPFPLLTLVTSLEAIFLTTFVLISQNHQGLAADRRNHLDLQINLLAEQENSKILTMLSQIMHHMNMAPRDAEAEILQETTSPNKLAQQIAATMEQEAATDAADSANTPSDATDSQQFP